MTNVNVAATRLLPQAGAGSAGQKMGYILAGGKAAQNDTWTVTNASKVLKAFITVDATGAAEAHTISANVITLTSATTGACSAQIIYQ